MSAARSPRRMDSDLRGARLLVLNRPHDSLRVLRRQASLPDSDAQIAVTVTVPRRQIDDSLRQISRPLAIALAVLGIAGAGFAGMNGLLPV